MKQANVEGSDFKDVNILADIGRNFSDTDTAKIAVDSAREQVYSRLRYAVINAIPHEYAAILAVFGETKSIPSREHVSSSIEYATIPSRDGRQQYIVIGNISGAGIAQAAAVAARVKYKCRHITKILLVGIAAGQPNLDDNEKDIRLGDIVVSDKLIQYDHISRKDGVIELRGDRLPVPDADLLGVVHKLRARQELASETPRPWQEYISSYEKKIKGAKRPPLEADKFHNMRNYSKGLEYERTPNEPHVHLGTVGSASTLLKDAAYRNQLNSDYKIVAFEMEGAGLAITASTNGFGYLVVRGICDYADIDKNDSWQRYASLCAASFSRCVLEAL